MGIDNGYTVKGFGIQEIPIFKVRVNHDNDNFNREGDADRRTGSQVWGMC